MLQKCIFFLKAAIRRARSLFVGIRKAIFDSEILSRLWRESFRIGVATIKQVESMMVSASTGNSLRTNAVLDSGADEHILRIAEALEPEKVKTWKDPEKAFATAAGRI